MTLKQDNVELVILASCVLHNLIQIRNPAATEGDVECQATHQLLEGDWRQDNSLPGIPPSGASRSTFMAKRQRDYLKDYFSSPRGSVSWQGAMI